LTATFGTNNLRAGRAINQYGEKRNMHTTPLGAKGSFTLVVGPEHLANRFKDAMLPPVLATPIM
jgi:hypothetical protein